MSEYKSTFPFLNVAKRYGVSYAAVLWFSEHFEFGVFPEPCRVPALLRHLDCFKSSRWYDEPWATSTMAAVILERVRRSGGRRS